MWQFLKQKISNEISACVTKIAEKINLRNVVYATEAQKILSIFNNITARLNTIWIFSFLVMSTQDSTRLYCSICKRRVKGFKNRSGLQRHETLKHMFYNTLPSHIQPVPDSELSHLKKAIIKELQKRLKNHYTAVGKQVFSVHCSEDAFVGIFKNHITRYSPCGSFYLCSFKGEKAFDEIGKILDDENWGNVNMEKVN
ncbi:hypothetical protein RhiirC2_868251 [Rhizophagus irregularis]|uniref:Uncharacterized protein n=1 Tax=Rhizophagus irregularis TaxID=588596 RepID=A0A2N1MY07_9GLOM|nr:hypothetical protein RhiirC2_868251 [Rhizophagus irregularis]